MCTPQWLLFSLTTSFVWCTSGEYPGASPVLVYINDLFLSVHRSSAFSFADDAKLVKLIAELADSLKLPEDLTSLAHWSHYYLAFNTNKFRNLSFNNNLLISYTIDNSLITSSKTHRDLGIILFTDLSWKDHCNHISSEILLVLCKEFSW